MKNNQLIKVSMNLSKRSIENVEELSKIIHESNRTRVVTSSLEIARVILDRVMKGEKIIVRKNDGSEQELTFNL